MIFVNVGSTVRVAVRLVEAGGVPHHHGVVACIGQLHVRQNQTDVGLARQVAQVELPLILERRRATRSGLEHKVGTRAY